MNRIEEIATRAMDIVSCLRMVKGQVERTWDPKLYDQVFAELIIEECAAYLNGAVEVHNQKEQDLVDLAARKIKEHFGVSDV
jgi:capsular polysaccharide biosynthesis protein